MKNNKYVAITGGLGNQLFQIAAGLASKPDHLFVISCLGDPRSAYLTPDIATYDFRGKVDFVDCNKRHRFTKKIFYLFISTSGRRNIINRNFVSRTLLQILGSIIFSRHFNKLLIPKVPNGSGYDNLFENRRGNMLIGYFQTFRISDDVMNFMKSIRLKENSQLIDTLAKRAQEEKPLVIHVRRGDYKSEEAFGILKQEYYKSAIGQLSMNLERDSAWLFSDEPEEAKKSLPTNLNSIIKEVDPGTLSSVATLEIMRLGHRYVIANSSFSWWAAQLSKNENKVVIAPNPWFIGITEPQDLIPPDWIRVIRD